MTEYAYCELKGEATTKEGWEDWCEYAESGDIIHLPSKETIDAYLIPPDGKEFDCWYEVFDTYELPEVLEESHKYAAGSEYVIQDGDYYEIVMIAVWKEIPKPEIKIYDSCYSVLLEILNK